MNVSNTIKLNNLLVGITSMNDLREIQDVINNHHKKLTRRACDTFNIGDKVVFRSRGGLLIQGIVIRINRETVAVVENKTSRTWRVSPSLLQKAQTGAI